MNLGPTELVLLLIVMLFVFGPKRIPEIGKSAGEALSSFRKATREDFTESAKSEESAEANRAS